DLTELDLELIRCFVLKTEDHVSNHTFECMRHAFRRNESVGRFSTIKTRVRRLAQFEPRLYDCCINSCCCFVGPLAEEQVCSYCKQPRFDSQGKARKSFTYIPLIPRLVNFFKNVDMITKMEYRSNCAPDPLSMHDIFDGSNYQRLKTENVTLPGEPQPMAHKFFDSPTDIALGMSTDGFTPFKRRKQT
ncbi:hypothetical protein CPC08DRAFT_618684, partial [Agrocybe pediades]